MYKENFTDLRVLAYQSSHRLKGLAENIPRNSSIRQLLSHRNCPNNKAIRGSITIKMLLAVFQLEIAGNYQYTLVVLLLIPR